MLPLLRARKELISVEVNILWLGDEPFLPVCEVRPLQAVPSLTALHGLPEDSSCAVVLDLRQGCPYSVSHILAAANLLTTTPHRLFALLPTDAPKALMSGLTVLPEDTEQAQALIRHKMAADGASPKPVKKSKPRGPTPALRLYGAILILAVAGSQSRIGCTTQTFQLWHCCRQLGLQSAVVMAEEQRASLARFLDTKPRDGGILLGEIPILDGMNYEFDCYLEDLGVLTPDKQARFQKADCGVLVMGGKPWELSHTADALHLAEAQKRLLLLPSFCSDAAADELRKAFPDQPLAAASWCPDLFQPSKPDLQEALLPLLEQAIDDE